MAYESPYRPKKLTQSQAIGVCRDGPFRTFRLTADHSYALWTAVGWPQLKAVTGDQLVMARFHGWTRQVLSFASSNS